MKVNWRNAVLLATTTAIVSAVAFASGAAAAGSSSSMPPFMIALVVAVPFVAVLGYLGLRYHLAQKHHEKSPKIERPPAHRLSRVLGLLFGSRAFHRIFGQIVADAHFEWLEAAKKGDEKAMRAVKIRTPLHLLAAAATYPLAWIAKQVDALRKISGGGGGE